MRPSRPFLEDDLAELDETLLSRADRVVAMVDVFKGDTGPGVIAMRHDVDDSHGSLDTALRMAEWEAARGYRSTYYLLHGSHYWPNRDAARELVKLGHEVGLHINCVAEAIRQSRDPHDILTETLHELRCAVCVVGVVGHGDSLCRASDGSVRFCNDEVFLECARPALGAHDRTIDGVKLEPRSMWDYGIKYNAIWLPRAAVLSDSGGRWTDGYEGSFEDTAASFPFAGQLHVLQHPDHWAPAFVHEAVAA